MFSVLLTVISSLITYLQLSIPLVVYTRESEMTLDNHWCQRMPGKQRNVLNLTSRDASGLHLAEQVYGGTTL